MRETVFLPFFDFFHVVKRFFTHSFQENFTDSMKFSRTLFINFSRIGYFFSRVLFEKIPRIGYYFHGQKLQDFSRKAHLFSRIYYRIITIICNSINAESVY